MPLGSDSRASFYQRVYALVRSVPPGRVTTYGAIAWALGRPGWARQVGWAMAALDGDHGVPAHRVVNARGGLSGDPFGGCASRRAQLQAEGVTFLADGRIDLERYLWLPEAASDPIANPPTGEQT